MRRLAIGLLGVALGACPDLADNSPFPCAGALYDTSRCPDGFACAFGTCVDACASASDCGGGQACYDGGCVLECDPELCGAGDQCFRVPGGEPLCVSDGVAEGTGGTGPVSTAGNSGPVMTSANPTATGDDGDDGVGSAGVGSGNATAPIEEEWHCVDGVDLNVVELACSNPGLRIDEIDLAVWGTGSGTCTDYVPTPCHSDVSDEVASRCLGQEQCSLTVDETTLGPDPCFGTLKRLLVFAACRL